MAQPARRINPVPDDPPVDPDAIDHAYRLHRARRRVRLERHRERSRARLRFLVAVFLLVAAAIALLLTIWHEVQSVFGL
jgi:hypothetical protein